MATSAPPLSPTSPLARDGLRDGLQQAPWPAGASTYTREASSVCSSARSRAAALAATITAATITATAAVWHVATGVRGQSSCAHERARRAARAARRAAAPPPPSPRI